MYPFSDAAKKAFERQALPFAFYQVTDGRFRPVLVSDGFCKLLSLSREQMLSEQEGSQFNRIHPEDVGMIARAMADFRERKNKYDVVYRARFEDGEYHYVHSVATWQPAPDGSELALVVYLDLNQWTREMQILKEQYGAFTKDHFYTDPLTELPNMNYLHHFADERVHAIRAAGNTPMLIYTDTNSMQFYNNQYGFARGNDLLRQIAEELTEAFPGGLVMRGAEVHFIVIDAFTSREKIAEKIRLVNGNIRMRAYGNTSGIQAGVCVYGEEDHTAETFDRAKQALKLIKDDLNQVTHFYSRGDDEWYWKQRYIIETFDRALKEGWVRVYYQCISRVSTGKGAAHEALARWADPVRGIISPGDFIPVLRKYHLLYKLDLYMMEQVCREIPIRVQKGLPLLPVSINYAAQDFDYVDIPSRIDELYDRYGMGRYVPKDYFVIEITEQDIATATDRFRDQLIRLRQSGYRLWLDDFGSGYSSLSVFSHFNFDMIKFDMELLRNLDEHHGVNRRIIRAMIGMAREMGIHTLAEGMETEAQRRFLIESGCELAQGYLFHKPEPLDVILYRMERGEKSSRECETPEERTANIRKWFE